MEADRPTPPATRPVRGPARARRSPTTDPGPPAPSKVALQLKLEPRTKLWLETQALGLQTTVSAIVERMVEAQPAGWTLSRPRAPAETRLAIADTDDPADPQCKALAG